MRGACVLIGLALLCPATLGPPPPLESFYIGRSTFSDAVAAWSEELLEVTSRDDGVRVRVIRVSLANLHCDRVIVQAAERIFPGTTVGTMAGQNLCALDGKTVESAVARASARSTGVYESAKSTIVARCGGREHVLSFTYDSTINWTALERRDPRIAAAGRLYLQLRARAFGERFSFDPRNVEADRQQSALGTTVVPDILAGRFDTFFGTRFTSELGGYTGPPSRDLAPAELLERAALTFDSYVPIAIPQIALTMNAHGDVRLRLTVDPPTGDVTGVDALSGPSILASTASEGVRRWRFTPGSISDGHVDVTLRFEVRCGE
jgi:Gram-negative bacterial TonB protein C-terminal